MKHEKNEPGQVGVVAAARALYGVLRNPDDTKQVFRLLEALSGHTPVSVRRGFERSRGGAALLAARPDVLAALSDRERLAAMPEGSLGRAYLDFMEKDALSADFLVGAHRDATGGPRQADETLDYIERRLRDSHDLWHVVTGYRGDLLGEAALLGFTFAQTRSRGIGVLIGTGYLIADDPDARRLIVDGFVRGLRAAWLPAVPWESWLADPLEVVRSRLRVGAPPSYEPFHAKDLPEGGLLSRAA